LAKLKSEPLTQLERIAAVHEKYSALVMRQAELIARYDAICEEANGPKGRIDGTVSGTTGAVTYNPVPLAEQFRRSLASWTAQLPKFKPKPIVRHEGAVKLVSEFLEEQPPEEINPPAPQPLWNGEDKLRALGDEAEAIQEALKLIAPALAKGRRDYSKLVAEKRGAEYQTIAERVVDAAKAFGDALLAHHEFINQQRLDGVAYSTFRPLNLSRFGNLNEPDQPLLRTILDAFELGHVGAGKVPDWKIPAPIEYFNGGN
jgi:hypothetical protein